MPPAAVRPWLPRAFAVATVAFTCVLVYATHHPRPEKLLGPNSPSDKTLHFVAYATLASLAAATWLTARRAARWNIAILAAALVAFGAVDEVTQPFFNRHAEPLDWLYDCIGIALGMAAVSAWFAIARFRAAAEHPPRPAGDQ